MKDMRKLWFQPVQTGWNPRFFERYFETPLGAAIRTREEQSIYDFIGTVMKPHHSVLEVGCGTGNYTVPVARRCKEVLAVDSSPEMLEYLQDRLPREGLANVEARLGQLPDRLGATPGEFDGAMVIGVLNYAEDLKQSLQMLASVLKPGGWAVFNVPVPTIEGWIYAFSEFLNRRRAFLLSPAEIVRLTESTSLQVEMTDAVGLSRGGLTLVVGTVASGESSSGPA
jgi:cyclopropane fatty-acyl-phospholipid synthase-like methyltransferase